VKIALVTHVRSRVGGTETYIEQLAGGLHAAGHDVALWCEHDGAPGRGFIELPAGAPSWSVESLGAHRALDGLAAWKPDVVFSHGVSTPDVEESILSLGPVAMFAHAYHGACISGTKSRLSPRRTPCDRPLGVPCLFHYLPRRCGGLNPLTMVNRYALETKRRDMLARYSAIFTASSHMRREYLKYDLVPERVHTVGLMLTQPESSAGSIAATPHERGAHDIAKAWRLLFVARLTALKGGKTLLDALVPLRRVFAGRIVLTIAGDGSERAALESRAAHLRSVLSDVEIHVTGWLGPAALQQTMQRTDLLVVPSIWPEPYGLVGPEAGRYGVPSAAFAVGGIPDWLRDGVNGHLAPADPPSAEGLAAAIHRCLADPAHHARLRAGALLQARELSPEQHIPRVVALLTHAATGNPAPKAA
jgi:glycosyltransferase involved in cell wall biosynthesis